MRRNIRSALLIFILSFLTPALLCAMDFKIIETMPSNMIKINGGKLNNIEQGAEGRIFFWKSNREFYYADFRITEVRDTESIAEVTQIKSGKVVAVGHYLEFYKPPMGTLSITTNAPDAEVAIGKDIIEKAPIINKVLPPGPYEIRVSAPKYSPIAKKIVLGPGDNKKEELNLVLEMGQLIIVTTPSGATVFVNGTEKGLTPFNQRLVAAEYDLIIRKVGFNDFPDIVTIEKDKPVSKNYTLIPLPPEPALLEIVTDPVGATIFIDKDLQPEKTPCKVEIRDAEVNLRIQKEHFLPYSEIIKRANLPKKIQQNLIQFEFKLTIKSNPPEAMVTLKKGENWIHTGATPFEAWLEKGLYQLELEKEGYKKEGPKPISIDQNDVSPDPIDLKRRLNGSVSVLTNPMVGNIEIDGKPYEKGEKNQKIVLSEGPHKISISFENGAIYNDMLNIEGGVDLPTKNYDFRELRNKLFNPCQYKLVSQKVSISVGIDDLTKKIPPPAAEYWVRQGPHQLVLDFPSDKKILKIRVQDVFANIGTRKIDLDPSVVPFNEAKNIPGGDSFLNDVEHDFIRIISNRKYNISVDKERDLEVPDDRREFTFKQPEMDSHEINLKPVGESGSFIITIELFKIRERRLYSVKLTFPE